ncbi:MAG: hypothetical protein ACTHK2_00105, partial [Dokdonella sp.]|uniref:hypothetical protein n=1 Tax=Dokdonella sp. TaxID=2291710 RepID=UPI003F80088E
MTAGMQRVLVYGANGYTGTLIAGEAVRRGLAPVLGGRNREAVEALAGRLGLPARVFGLDDAGALARGLDGIDLLLNCAGPFSRTAAPGRRGGPAERGQKHPRPRAGGLLGPN